MSFTRKSKILLALLAVPLILIVAAVVVLKVMFTSDKLKALVIPRIEDAIHRPVAVNDIGLTLLPSIGLDVDGLSIANRQGPGFSETPLVTLDKLHLNVKIMPLFSGRIVVSSVVVDKPKLLIETNEANETNYADLTGPPETTAVAQPAPTITRPQEPSTVGALSISGFRLNDGSIDLVNQKDNSATRIRDLNADLSLDWQSGVLTIASNASVGDLSYGSVDAPLISGLKISLAPKIVYDSQKDILTMEKGDVNVQSMSLSLVGTVSDVQKVMRLDLKAGSDNLNIAELLSLVPKEYMKNAEGLSGKGTASVHLSVTGTMSDSTTPDVEGTINTTGASVQYAKLPKPISNIAIVSRFVRSKTLEEFYIEKLTASLGDNPVALTMDVRNFENPSLTLTFKGSLNLAEINQYYPLEAGTSVSGIMTADVNIAGEVKDPSTLKATGTMQFLDVTAKTASTEKPVQNLTGSITFNNQLVESKDLSMTIGKSDLSLAFWLKNYLSLASTDKNAPRPVANITLQSKHLYTADIMKEEAPVQQTSSPAPQKTTPAARTEAKPTEKVSGQKTTLPFPTMEIDVTGNVGTFTMQQYEFTGVRMTMHISNGVVSMQNFSMNAFGGSVISKGSVNLQNPEKPVFDLALDVNGVDAPTMLTHFTSFGSRLKGKLTMNTTMKGALNDTLGIIPNTLDGDGKVMIQNGSLDGFKVNQSIANALKLPDLQNIAFKDWSNNFIVKDGRVVIKDLKISALNADYVVNGSQGIDGSLDYATSLYLPATTSSKVSVGGFAGEAINAFKDPSGRLKFDFNVGGTTDDPKVQLNTEEQRKRVEDAAKQKVQEEAKKLEDKAKEKAGDVLRNIFKGKKK